MKKYEIEGYLLSNGVAVVNCQYPGNADLYRLRLSDDSEILIEFHGDPISVSWGGKGSNEYVAVVDFGEHVVDSDVAEAMGIPYGDVLELARRVVFRRCCQQLSVLGGVGDTPTVPTSLAAKEVSI